MKTSTTTTFIVFATIIALAEAGSRHRGPQSQEEDDNERYQKAFAYIFFALGLSVAPILGRFIVCLFTDPAVPILLKEMKKRGKWLLLEKFGSNLGDEMRAKENDNTKKKDS